MTEEPVNDDFFSRVMSRGKLKISNEVFERDLLEKIEHENWKQRFFVKNRILSILFFVLGISLCFWKFGYLVESLQFALNLSFQNTVFLIQILFALFFLFQINNIFKLFFKH